MDYCFHPLVSACWKNPFVHIWRILLTCQMTMVVVFVMYDLPLLDQRKWRWNSVELHAEHPPCFLFDLVAVGIHRFFEVRVQWLS
jgi:hypothetical protein